MQPLSIDMQIGSTKGSQKGVESNVRNKGIQKGSRDSYGKLLESPIEKAMWSGDGKLKWSGKNTLDCFSTPYGKLL